MVETACSTSVTVCDLYSCTTPQADIGELAMSRVDSSRNRPVLPGILPALSLYGLVLQGDLLRAHLFVKGVNANGELVPFKPHNLRNSEPGKCVALCNIFKSFTILISDKNLAISLRLLPHFHWDSTRSALQSAVQQFISSICFKAQSMHQSRALSCGRVQRYGRARASHAFHKGCQVCTMGGLP